jgi:two-component system, sensor histidine kinase and response regulator
VVTVAANGKKALEAMERETYDVVLMDVQMPVMDGWEATRSIRAKEKMTGGHIPIVAVTAHAMKGDEDRCRQAGMDHYLTKPLRTHELFAILEKIPNAAESIARHRESDPKVPSESSVDLVGVLERLEGDRALFDELTHLFEEDSPKNIEGMRRAIILQDAKGLEYHAHTLKGSSSNLGALAVSFAAGEIERLAASGNMNIVGDQFRVLQEEIERLFSELEVLREQR